MMEKTFNKVAVLMGGPSSERDVSLRSGAAIAKGLRQAGYSVSEVDVTVRQLNVPEGIEAVFIALHGEFGEDGTVQDLLRQKGIPYTGSGPEASRLAFDKAASKKVLGKNNIPTPAWEILDHSHSRRIPVPLVVKPSRQGSSIGVHLVFEDGQWVAAFEDVLAYDREVLVEAYIDGHELTVGVVNGQVLPVIEIRAPDGFYNYNAKYSRGLTEYLVPAPLDEAVTRACQDYALRTFEVLGCAGMGRVDLRMNSKGELFVLELNSIPGFTETSLLPKAAAAAGISFPDLCDRILRSASVH
ncbi:MAG: D-alanine--D-alanine ligase [Lentisphaerota bacterium]